MISDSPSLPRRAVKKKFAYFNRQSLWCLLCVLDPHLLGHLPYLRHHHLPWYLLQHRQQCQSHLPQLRLLGLLSWSHRFSHPGSYYLHLHSQHSSSLSLLFPVQLPKGKSQVLKFFLRGIAVILTSHDSPNQAQFNWSGPQSQLYHRRFLLHLRQR